MPAPAGGAALCAPGLIRSAAPGAGIRSGGMSRAFGGRGAAPVAALEPPPCLPPGEAGRERAGPRL